MLLVFVGEGTNNLKGVHCMSHTISRLILQYYSNTFSLFLFSFSLFSHLSTTIVIRIALFCICVHNQTITTIRF